MDYLIGILVCALLFALYGVVQHRGCTGHCAGCTGACGRAERLDHHD
jgi:hypothetical protein